MNLDEIDVVSWDVDGTLYSLPLMSSAVLGLFMARLCSKNALSACREVVLLHQIRRTMRRIRAAEGSMSSHRLQPELQQRLLIEKRWYGQAIKRIGLRGGVLDVIMRFKNAGLRQIIVSDYVSDYKLEMLGLDNIFDGMYAGEILGFVKPSPRLFTMVAKDQGVSANRILHIGDNEARDGRAAREAGCRVAILGNDFCTFRHFLATIESP